MRDKKSLQVVKPRRRELAVIAFWQFSTFVMLLLLVWVNQVLDLPSLLGGAVPSTMQIVSGVVLSAGVLIVALITIGHTYLQQKRMLTGLVTVCSKCHKVKEEEAWARFDEYITVHSRLGVSHGLCPTCYENEMAALEQQMGSLVARSA
jgi:hypothetical protein